VPARGGSQRVPGKNIRVLDGHPLLAYTIAAADESGVFVDVVVSTDSPEIAEVARQYGGEVRALRPAELATATSPDIEWVLHEMEGRDADVFAILRPTSPFRRAATIRRALDRLVELGERADSIRAVELVKQHPGKMWIIEDELMKPLLPQPVTGPPLHSQQFASLPRVFVQNSSLELAWTRVLDPPRPSIAGDKVAPFLTDGPEGFSIDYPGDFETAERMLASGGAKLTRPVRVPGP
jgi:N-acylneuraminate cytidylyltransferase